MVTLARFGLTTGFLLGPADDRRVLPSLLPQKLYSMQSSAEGKHKESDKVAERCSRKVNYVE